MKKLYRVTVEKTFEVLVVAEDVEAAEGIASAVVDDTEEDVNPDEVVATAHQITTEYQIPEAWLGAIPFGTDTDDTVEKYLPEAAS